MGARRKRKEALDKGTNKARRALRGATLATNTTFWCTKKQPKSLPPYLYYGLRICPGPTGGAYGVPPTPWLHLGETEWRREEGRERTGMKWTVRK